MSTAAPETRPGPKFVTPVGGAKREDEERREKPNLYKSLLMTRLLIGIVGVLLPTFILLWDLGLDLLANRALRPLGSLSAYYYHPSPLGDWFVGSLWAIGVGLMVYVGTRKSTFANRVSWGAGAAALVVALFPTNDGGTPSSWVSNLHFIAAAVVILGLGALCVGFGIYDNERSDRDQGKAQYRGIHYGAAAAILVAVLLVVAHKLFGLWPNYGVLIAEALAVYAFAISWFAKGWEVFDGTRTRPSGPAGTTSPPAPESTSDPDPDPDPDPAAALAGRRART